MHLVPYATSTNLTNLAIPMIVGGTMANPHVVPDAEAMATGTLNTVVGAPVSVLGAVGSVVGIGGSGSGSTSTNSGCGAAAPTTTKTTTTTTPAATTGTAGANTGSSNPLDSVGGALKSLLP